MGLGLTGERHDSCGETAAERQLPSSDPDCTCHCQKAVLQHQGVFREEALAAVNPDVAAACFKAMDDSEKRVFLHTLSGPHRAAMLTEMSDEDKRSVLGILSTLDITRTLRDMPEDARKHVVAMMPAKRRDSAIQHLTPEEKELLQNQVIAGSQPTEALARVASGLAIPDEPSAAPEGHSTMMSHLDESERLKIIEVQFPASGCFR